MLSNSSSDPYVHGYSDREHARLLDQATTLAELLHEGTRYPPGASVLEAGCGVGAQTVTLARNSPGARFTCIDVSPRSLDAARARAHAASLENVAFQQADIFELPFPEESFDHVRCQNTSGADRRGAEQGSVDVAAGTSPRGAAEDAWWTRPGLRAQWAGPRKVRVAVAISYAARR